MRLRSPRIGKQVHWWSGVGRREEAVASAQVAVTMRRGLAEAKPGAYLPDLAMSLGVIGWICATCAVQTEVELEAVEEADALFAALAQGLPTGYLARWRSVQSVRVDLLEVLGRAGEATKIRRHLKPGAD